jgi:hypothetical protein
MSQCLYMIKDARDIGFWNCKLEEGHDARELGMHATDHKPHPPAVGRQHEFSGKWFKPGDAPAPDPPQQSGEPMNRATATVWHVNVAPMSNEELREKLASMLERGVITLDQLESPLPKKVLKNATSTT